MINISKNEPKQDTGNILSSSLPGRGNNVDTLYGEDIRGNCLILGKSPSSRLVGQNLDTESRAVNPMIKYAALDDKSVSRAQVYKIGVN